MLILILDSQKIPLPPWAAPLLPFVVVGFFLFVSMQIAQRSGWAVLGRMYPAAGAVQGEEFFAASASMGGGSFPWATTTA